MDNDISEKLNKIIELLEEINTNIITIEENTAISATERARRQEQGY